MPVVPLDAALDEAEPACVERDDGGTDVGELQQAEAEEEEDVTMFEDLTMF